MRFPGWKQRRKSGLDVPEKGWNAGAKTKSSRRWWEEGAVRWRLMVYMKSYQCGMVS